MHMSLKTCHVLVDRKPFNNYIKQRSSLVSVNMGKRLSAKQIENATKIEEQSLEEESETTDTNEINDKIVDITENGNSLNEHLNVVKTTFDEKKVPHLPTSEAVGDNNSALTDVSATEIDTLLSITGNFDYKSWSYESGPVRKFSHTSCFQ